MKKTLFFAIFFSLLVVGGEARAESGKGLNISITPPMMKLNMEPGESINTAVKLVNNNHNDLPVYIQIKDFKGRDKGQLEFIDHSDNQYSTSSNEVSSKFLSGWIGLPEDSVTIPPRDSKNIAFSINVPEDAGPGGYYAAILAGTQPPEAGDGTNIKISSVVTSLILLNIKGDAVENGGIREFYTSKKIYNNDKVDFHLTFENKGNTHLQPTGEIKIYDWWGNNEKNISINKNTSFGNVLPDSVRSWDFEWSASNNALKMGRYKAKLALSYGNVGKMSDYREINFWIVNWKFIIVSLVLVLLFLLVIVLVMRISVKGAIRNVEKQVGYMKNGKEGSGAIDLRKLKKRKSRKSKQ